MVAPSLIWQFASALAVICCWLLTVMPGAADSILAGAVIDAITLQPVAGAEVQIEYSGQTVGAGTSDIDGFYRVPFTIPPAAPTVLTMIASARSGGHGVTRSNFQVNAGTPVATAPQHRPLPEWCYGLSLARLGTQLLSAISFHRTAEILPTCRCESLDHWNTP